MKKFKKFIFLVLSLGFAATLLTAVACGKGGNDNDTGSTNGSSNQTSSDASSSDVPSSGGDSSDASSSDTSSSGGNSSDTSSSDTSEHVCVTEGEWISDTNGHWIACDCGEKLQYSEHTTEGLYCESKPICDICKAEYGAPSGHSYGLLTDGEYGEAYYCACGDYKTNADLVDFTVTVAEGKDPVVLQLSDTQMWDAHNVEEYCYRYVRETIEATNPDLIILTGDIVYGKFDDNGAIFTDFIAFMESFAIPWAPVFGNHDNESLKGVDWQCAQLEAAEHCLFKQRELTGNGNYSVGIIQGGRLLRVFYMLDSNGCSAPMTSNNGTKITPAEGTNEVKTSAGIADDQKLWYKASVTAVHNVFADVKISFAYHIQQAIFGDVPKKYSEYDPTVKAGSSSELQNPLHLDTLERAEETDFGYVGRLPKSAWGAKSTYIAELNALNVDSVFVGHEHCNSYSIVYEGIRFQYGQKSSQYDRYNWLTADGKIVGGYGSAMPATATPLMGGTVIPLSQEDGSVKTGYIYYCSEVFKPDPEKPQIVVNGLQYGTDLTVRVAGTLETVVYEGVNAYKFTSKDDYNKLYINPELLRGKTHVSFMILVPQAAVNTSGNKECEFAVRIKPNELAQYIPHSSNGYVYYDLDASGDLGITLNEWKMVTYDISQYSEACTEFSIYLFGGNNTVYVRDIFLDTILYD